MERRNHVYPEDIAMKEKDTSWEKPELIALTRSNSEEVILTGCKGAGDGPGSAFGDCLFESFDCLEITVS